MKALRRVTNKPGIISIILHTSLRAISFFNASGLTKRLKFCTKLLTRHNIDILLVQEVQWSSTVSTSTMSPALFHHLPFHPRPTDDSSARRTGTLHGLAVFLGNRLLPHRSEIMVLHEDETTQSTMTIRVSDAQITNVYFSPSIKYLTNVENRERSEHKGVEDSVPDHVDTGIRDGWTTHVVSSRYSRRVKEFY